MVYRCVVKYLDGEEESLRSQDIISYNFNGRGISLTGVSPPKIDLAIMVGEGHAILISKGELSSEIGRVIPIKGNVRHVSFEED